MKKILFILFCFVFWVWALPLSAQEVLPEQGGDYVIGTGDVLDISVWKDEALTKSVLVLPDGKITFPLIGVLTAAGKTIPELKKEIESKISKYVRDPVLSVGVQQTASMVIYVIGRVNSPGKFIMSANVTVLQALSMAGGLNPFAKKGAIKIFRQEGGKTGIYPFDYDEVVAEGRIQDNFRLERGDVVVVP